MITRAVCPVMIGREEELSRIEDALLAACRGDGSVVVVAGEAGVGKSRMAAEIASRAEKIGAATMEGSCSEAELALPYLPFLEAIGNHLTGADLATLREQLGPSARELSQLFPQLGAEAPAADTDTAQARLRLFEAVVTLLNLAAAGRGLLLIVEDLHWADASTRELLDYLSRRIRGSSILVLATYRKDEMHRRHPLLPTLQGWQRARLADVVELERLPPDGVARMVQAIFDTEIQGDTRDFLFERCEGNPFVLEEMLKDALDRGDIYRTAEGWERKPLEELGIPETVRDTILLRLSRLADADTELLRTASVLGRSFDYELLAEMSALDVAEVEDSLERLTEEQLVEEEQGTRYRFRHALTREAVYEAISAPRRRRLHGEVAEALRGRPAAPAAELAHHLFQAGRPQEALPIAIEAGRDALNAYGPREAVQLFRRALPFVTDPLEQARLVGEIGEALWGAGDVSATDELTEAIARLDALGQTREAAHLRCRLAMALNFAGDAEGAIAQAHRAREALEPEGPSADLVVAYLNIAVDGIARSDPEAGLVWARRALEIEDAAPDKTGLWMITGTLLGTAGRIEEALEMLERAYEAGARAGGADVAGSAAAVAAGNQVLFLVEHLRAREGLSRLDRLQRLPGAHARLTEPGVRAAVHTELGDLQAAMAAAEEQIAVSRAERSPSTEQLGELGRLRLLVELGRFEEARGALGSSAQSEPQVAVFAAISAVELHLAEGKADDAAAAARAVLPLGPAVLHSGSALDAVVRGLLEGGDADAAAALVDRVEADPALKQHPLHTLPRARVRLARGDNTGALELARQAADRFAAAGYAPLECRARLLLAQALLELDEVEAAKHELRRCWSEAVRIGSRLMEKPARDLLFQLGVEVEPLPAAAPVVEPEIIGEKLVTVMFADVRGFTAMSGATGPAEMADRISSYQRWAKQEIEKQHGLVDKFAGDAVMATFNVSGTEVDHALHALKAALALRDKAALLGLPVGIGIAVGAAVVGKLTGGANTSVLGETTNLAARLQAQAEAGEVILSAEARRRLQGWLEEHGYETTGETLSLKGFAEPVRAHRLRRAGEAAPVRP